MPKRGETAYRDQLHPVDVIPLRLEAVNRLRQGAVCLLPREGGYQSRLEAVNRLRQLVVDR